MLQVLTSPKRAAALAAGLLLAAACGRRAAEGDGGPLSPPLAAKVARYGELVAGRRDRHGFVETDTCDSIHWSALTGAAGGPIELAAAVAPDGQVFRRPIGDYPECYAAGASASTISNDALSMVLAYAIAHGERELIERIYAYGRSHLWQMGAGDPFATFLRPSLIGLYARAIAKLGGADHPLERQIPTFVTVTARGYEAHLQVVGLMILARIEGGLPEAGVAVLRRQVAREPNNALYRAALGRFDAAEREAAERLLLTEAYWPADRLPSSADRCEGWLTQRDEVIWRALTADETGCVEYVEPATREVGRECGLAPGSVVSRATLNPDWLPCPTEGRVHSGGDFIFAAAVLSGSF